MRPSTLFATPMLAAVLFCFAACADDNDADNGTSSSTDSTSAVSSTTPASTISTTPQHMMVARHKVTDFDKWLASYEAHDSLRRANGIHNYVIGRSTKDPNMVLVAVKVDDINKAKAFSKDPALKQAMQKGGVAGTPVFNFTRMTFQDTAMVNADVRSMSTFTVKDWARWQHSFDSSRQTNYDNGLMIRSYGHDADDDHKVVVVSAIIDSAKASDYWKSDMLKQRRAASGAGEPERFIFRIVKRY